MVWGVPLLPNSFSPDSNPADTWGSAYGLEQGASGADRLLLPEARQGDGGGRPGQLHRPAWLGIQRRLVPLGRQRQAAAFVGFWQQVVTRCGPFPASTSSSSGTRQRVIRASGISPTSTPATDRRLHRRRCLRPGWANYRGMRRNGSTYLTGPFGLNWLASFAASQGKSDHPSRVGPRPKSVVQRRRTGFTTRYRSRGR